MLIGDILRDVTLQLSNFGVVVVAFGKASGAQEGNRIFLSCIDSSGLNRFGLFRLNCLL
jgi:hypothetical protein